MLVSSVRDLLGVKKNIVGGSVRACMHVRNGIVYHASGLIKITLGHKWKDDITFMLTLLFNEGPHLPVTLPHNDRDGLFTGSTEHELHHKTSHSSARGDK